MREHGDTPSSEWFRHLFKQTPKYTDRNGNVRKGVSRYRLGTPSRAIIAAGYKALAGFKGSCLSFNIR